MGIGPAKEPEPAVPVPGKELEEHNKSNGFQKTQNITDEHTHVAGTL